MVGETTNLRAQQEALRAALEALEAEGVPMPTTPGFWALEAHRLNLESRLASVRARLLDIEADSLEGRDRIEALKVATSMRATLASMHAKTISAANATKHDRLCRLEELAAEQREADEALDALH